MQAQLWQVHVRLALGSSQPLAEASVAGSPARLCLSLCLLCFTLFCNKSNSHFLENLKKHRKAQVGKCSGQCVRLQLIWFRSPFPCSIKDTVIFRESDPAEMWVHVPLQGPLRLPAASRKCLSGTGVPGPLPGGVCREWPGVCTRGSWVPSTLPVPCCVPQSLAGLACERWLW